MSAGPLPGMSAEEYLLTDRAAEWKSEFHDGELFPMEAVSLRHSTILDNLIGAVRPRLKPVGCQGLPGPLRVRATPSKYVYPDYMIICGKADLADALTDTLTNPKVIVEILSPSTADYDHGGKFALYRGLPSMEEYVLISQIEPKIEVFTKQGPNSWSLTIFEAAGQKVRLQAIGIEFELGELYEGVEFDAIR